MSLASFIIKKSIQLFCNNCNIYAFYVRKAFISNARLKLAKNQAKAKQHPKVEISLFENNSLSLSTLLPKNKRRYSKRCTKKQGRFFK